MKSLLKVAPRRVSFTSDLWSSLTSDGYLCLTCHFIDKNWNLHKKVLNFNVMPPPHVGLALSEKIYGLLCEWGLKNKVFSITLNNSANNEVSTDALQIQLKLKGLLICNGEHFHLCCCTHILNLVVQEGMKELDLCILKIKESMKYVKRSQLRKQKFMDCVGLVCDGNKRGLSQDVSTRWNLTCHMFKSALFFIIRHSNI